MKEGDIIYSIQEYLHHFWSKFEHDVGVGGGGGDIFHRLRHFVVDAPAAATAAILTSSLPAPAAALAAATTAIDGIPMTVAAEVAAAAT